MASSSAFRYDVEDNDVEGVIKWALDYEAETKEYKCGKCGQVLSPDQTVESLATHFKSCKQSEDDRRFKKMAERKEANATIDRSKLEEDKVTSSAANQELSRLETGMELVSLQSLKSLPVKNTPLEDEITMTCFNLVTRNHLFQPSLRWTIDGIKTILKRENFELSSEMFQWNGYPVQARAKFQLKEDGCIYVSLRLNDVLDGETKDDPLIPHVFYLLRDKYSARNSRHKCRSMGYILGSAFTSSLEFDQCLSRKCWLSHSTYKVNNSVEIEVYVEPFTMTQQVHSYDGTLEWVIEDYVSRVQLEKSRLVDHQESPYFYTSPRGYRVQVSLFLKEAEGKEGLAAIISFMTGHFDAVLPRSFAHSTTVTLINRKEPERSISKTVVGDIEKKQEYGFEICKVEEVENVVENDTVFCRVNIKAH